jgi:glycosyltransferase involved in cell wall biosynthesis
MLNSAVGRGSGPRIVHVTTVPQNLRFLRGLLRFLHERGCDVHVLSSPGSELDGFARQEGVTAHAIPIERRIAPASDLRSIARLAQLLRQLAPDLVHAHTPKGGLVGMLAARAAGVPRAVYHMRGLPLETATGSTRGMLWLSERTACALSDRVLCVSDSLAEVALSDGLCAPRKMRVLLKGSGNGVDAHGRYDPGRLAPGTRERVRALHAVAPDALVVGFVGRVAADKGISELCGAWRQLSERFPAARLLVVGALDERDPPPPDVVAALKADPRTRWIGDQGDMPALYAAMDVVALPTYREGFPNVVLEASAMRLPVVASRVTGCVDAVLHDRTGLLVPAKDSAQLAQALASYLESAELRARHGENGRRRVLEHYAQERLWEAILGLYAELLGRAAVVSGG